MTRRAQIVTAPWKIKFITRSFTCENSMKSKRISFRELWPKMILRGFILHVSRLRRRRVFTPVTWQVFIMYVDTYFHSVEGEYFNWAPVIYKSKSLSRSALQNNLFWYNEWMKSFNVVWPSKAEQKLLTKVKAPRR